MNGPDEKDCHEALQRKNKIVIAIVLYRIIHSDLLYVTNTPPIDDTVVVYALPLSTTS